MIYNASSYVLAVYHLIMICSNASDMIIEFASCEVTTYKNYLDLRTITTANSIDLRTFFRDKLSIPNFLNNFNLKLKDWKYKDVVSNDHIIRVIQFNFVSDYCYKSLNFHLSLMNTWVPLILYMSPVFICLGSDTKTHVPLLLGVLGSARQPSETLHSLVDGATMKAFACGWGRPTRANRQRVGESPRSPLSSQGRTMETTPRTISTFLFSPLFTGEIRRTNRPSWAHGSIFALQGVRIVRSCRFTQPGQDLSTKRAPLLERSWGQPSTPS